MYRTALAAGALFGAIAVMFGAFGAHSLKNFLAPDQMDIFKTGVQYQFLHSLALLAVGIIYQAYPVKNLRAATGFFIAGILLFSGSLYILPMLHTWKMTLGPVGLITPIGGVFFILGWMMLMITVLKKKLS